jgi:Mn-dependent DtxR family transcriptional regulator
MVSEKFLKIKKKVCGLVKKEAPISTGEVAEKMRVSWGTAQRTLYELERDKKVRGKKVSGRNIWVCFKK